MALVRLEGVTKRFATARSGEVTAVEGIDLDVADGELMVLLGPSGCGKSTLLRLVAGLEEPTSGTVHLDGVAVNRIDPGRRDVAMVFQSYALYPHKTARANIEFPLKVRGVPRAERRSAAEQAAAALGIVDVLGRRPAALSGGQRQRVALARAIVRRPAVFCMDEPLGNLDAQLRTATRAELVALQRRLGATFLYVTHDQVEAMTMGTRVAVLRAGRIEQVDTPRKLYDVPASVFVARFVGTPPMNVLPSGLVERGDHLVGARPEHMRIASGTDLGDLRVTVASVEDLGHEVLVTCLPPAGDPVVLRVAVGGAPAPGEEIGIEIPLAHRHRFAGATGVRLVEGEAP